MSLREKIQLGWVLLALALLARNLFRITIEKIVDWKLKNTKLILL